MASPKRTLSIGSEIEIWTTLKKVKANKADHDILTTLQLNCLIEGEDTPFPVTAGCDDKVGNLKNEIKKWCAVTLKDIDARCMELWKPKDTNPIAAKPTDTLIERIHIGLPRDDLSKLEATDTLRSIFPTQPPGEWIHIIVRVPCTTTISPSVSNESNASSTSSMSERDDRFSAIHKKFWQSGERLFVRHHAKIPNLSPPELDDNLEALELVVIDLPEGSHKAFTAGVPKLLVVPIYETFWKILEHEDELWQAEPKFSRLCHGTIITGQPGIGKSVFLIYVLLRRLAHGMTTVYCDSDARVHIFDNTGVRKLPLSKEVRIRELDNNSKCCALVNLGDKLTSVPQVFYPEIRAGRVVVATSPSTQHWFSFSHEHPAKRCCMPTWEWGHLYFASLLHAGKDLNTLDLDHCQALRSNYSIFHGIPRSCLWSLDSEFLEIEKMKIQEALKSSTFLDDFAHSFTGQLPINPKTSHSLVRVEPADTKWLMTCTEIKSNYIAELVFEHIRALTKAQFLNKLMAYLADPNAQGSAGILFEQAVHYSIRKGLQLTMTPLPSGTTLDAISIPCIPDDMKEQSRYYSISIRAKPGSQDVDPKFLNLYMTPRSKIEASIDALFISSEYITYLFQMTVSSNHPIKFQGLDTVFKHLPAKAQKDVRFVFIIPTNGPSGEAHQGIQTVQTIAAPQNADVKRVEQFKQLPQYVCQLDMNKIGWA